METKIQEQFIKLIDSIVAYLPNLLAGILLILLGWLAGWIIKRIIVQVSMIIKVDRFFKRSRWEADLSKADVRYAIFNFIGDIGYAIVFIIFLDNALVAWKLTVLSDLLNRGIIFLPKVIIAIVIFFAGLLIASGVQFAVLKSLYREKIPRATLISKFIKSTLILFFSAIAFVELDIAREIVTIGFAAIFITFCAIAVAIVIIGGKDLLKKIEEAFEK